MVIRPSETQFHIQKVKNRPLFDGESPLSKREARKEPLSKREARKEPPIKVRSAERASYQSAKR